MGRGCMVDLCTEGSISHSVYMHLSSNMAGKSKHAQQY